MKLLDNLSNAYKGLFRRRRISVINTGNNHEEWFTHVSPMGLFLRVISIILSTFIVILFLAGYTSMLKVFPQYLTESDRTRISLFESVSRIDSIESRILNMIAFNENISLIMDGNSPITHNSIPQDSVDVQSTVALTNNLDALLRTQMELSERYNLNYQSLSEAESMMSSINLTPPIDGIITHQYNPSKGEYGVKIASSSQSMVYATDSGIILNSIWIPDSGYIVEILHPKGDLSMYKSLSKSLVERGQSVERGEVIALYNDSQEGDSQSQLFEFELWIDGKPVNPEHYINF